MGDFLDSQLGHNMMSLHGPAPFNLRDLKVGDLIVHGTKRWRQDLLREFLLPSQCDAVLRLPLHNSIANDTRVWWPNKLRWSVQCQIRLPSL